MEGWQWAPDLQQGVQWGLGGGPAGDAGAQQGSLEGFDSLPEAMAKSRQQASRRVSRSSSRQFERLASQVSAPHSAGRAVFQSAPMLLRIVSGTMLSGLEYTPDKRKAQGSSPSMPTLLLFSRNPFINQSLYRQLWESAKWSTLHSCLISVTASSVSCIWKHVLHATLNCSHTRHDATHSMLDALVLAVCIAAYALVYQAKLWLVLAQH